MFVTGMNYCMNEINKQIRIFHSARATKPLIFLLLCLPPLRFVANIFYRIAYEHVTCAVCKWSKDFTSKRKGVPWCMLYLVADVVWTGTLVGIGEHVSLHSNAQ